MLDWGSVAALMLLNPEWFITLPYLPPIHLFHGDPDEVTLLTCICCIFLSSCLHWTLFFTSLYNNLCSSTVFFRNQAFTTIILCCILRSVYSLASAALLLYQPWKAMNSSVMSWMFQCGAYTACLWCFVLLCDFINRFPNLPYLFFHAVVDTGRGTVTHLPSFCMLSACTCLVVSVFSCV